MPAARRAACRLFLALAAAACPLAGRAEEPQALVGELGAADRLVIRGLDAIDPERLRRPLLGDASLLPFSTPNAARAAYMQEVARRAEQALRHTGFATASVEPTVEMVEGLAKLVLTVNEGPRLEAGRVVIHGLPDDVAAIVEEGLRSPTLTEPALPDAVRLADGSTRTVWRASNGWLAETHPAIWPRSGPAPCDDATLHVMRWLVVSLLQDLGYLDIAPPGDPADSHPPAGSSTGLVDAGVEATIDPGDGPEATLTIRVAALPPRAWITRIDLPRGVATTPEEMAAFLGIAIGGPVTPRSGVEWTRRLDESGRFLRAVLSINRDLFEPGGRILRFDIVEYAPMMPLSRPLSREEETVLRCRRLLLEAVDGDRDVVLVNEPLEETSPSQRPGLIGRNGGESLRTDETVDAAAGAGEPRPTLVPRWRATLWGTKGIAIEAAGVDGQWHGIVASPGRARIAAPRGGGWLDVPLPMSLWLGLRVGVQVSRPKHLDTRQGADELDYKLNWVFDVKLKRDGTGELNVQASVPAVFCSVLLHERSPLVFWDGDDLVIRREGEAETRIDGRTGRPRQIGFFQRKMTLEERPGALAEAERDAGSAGRSRIRPDRALSSAVRFLVVDGGLEVVRSVVAPLFFDDEALARIDRGTEKIARLARQLDDDDALGAIDGAVWRRFASCPTGPTAPDLVIPVRGWGIGGHENPILALLPVAVWRTAERHLAADSWPMILVRSKAGAIADGRVLYHEMAPLVASESPGPLAYLAAASLSPDGKLTASLARRGLERATAERFLDDCRPLLLAAADIDPASVVRGILRGIDEESLGVLGVLSASDADAVVAVARKLRESEGAHSADMETMLAAAWEGGLGEAVVRRLRQFASADTGKQESWTVNGGTSTVTITTDGVTRSFTSRDTSATFSNDGTSFSFETK